MQWNSNLKFYEKLTRGTLLIINVIILTSSSIKLLYTCPLISICSKNTYQALQI